MNCWEIGKMRIGRMMAQMKGNIVGWVLIGSILTHSANDVGSPPVSGFYPLVSRILKNAQLPN
jgi:hypothetical protein